MLVAVSFYLSTSFESSSKRREMNEQLLKDLASQSESSFQNSKKKNFSSPAPLVRQIRLRFKLVSRSFGSLTSQQSFIIIIINPNPCDTQTRTGLVVVSYGRSLLFIEAVRFERHRAQSQPAQTKDCYGLRRRTLRQLQDEMVPVNSPLSLRSKIKSAKFVKTIDVEGFGRKPNCLPNCWQGCDWSIIIHITTVSRINCVLTLLRSSFQVQLWKGRTTKAVFTLKSQHDQRNMYQGNMFRLSMFVIALFTSYVGFKHVSCMFV